MFLSTKVEKFDGDDFNAPILMQIYSGETDRAGKQRDGAAWASFGLEIQPQIPCKSLMDVGRKTSSSLDKFSH